MGFSNPNTSETEYPKKTQVHHSQISHQGGGGNQLEVSFPSLPRQSTEAKT